MYANEFKTKEKQKVRWPEPIYMRVGIFLNCVFSAGMIQPISMIFGI